MDILEELEKAGAVLLDKHFVYKSGKHGSGYINMDPLFPYTGIMQRICQQLVYPFTLGYVDTIAGPATGGIPLVAHCVNYRSWEQGFQPNGIWADKDGADFAFKRAGFIDHIRGKRVLIVEDLLTTGSSVAKVIHEVELAGGEVIGVSAVCNRGGVTAEDLGVPRLESLATVSFEAIEVSDCLLCEQGVPIVEDIGHGDEYKITRPDYKGGYIKLLAA